MRSIFTEKSPFFCKWSQKCQNCSAVERLGKTKLKGLDNRKMMIKPEFQFQHYWRSRRKLDAEKMLKHQTTLSFYSSHFGWFLGLHDSCVTSVQSELELFDSTQSEWVVRNQLDSLHFFDSKLTLYFQNFKFKLLQSKMFRMQDNKLHLVKISMNHINNYFFIEKLPILVILQEKLAKFR